MSVDVATTQGFVYCNWASWALPPPTDEPPYDPDAFWDVWMEGEFFACDTWQTAFASGVQLHFPLAIVWLSASGALTVLVVRRLRRSGRARRGRCTKCNYDLRGNVSGVCPECGTEVTSTSQRCNELGDAQA